MREHPRIAPVWPRTGFGSALRRFVLQRFPFSIAYLIDGDHLIVLAIAHSRRRPLYWLDRIDQKN